MRLSPDELVLWKYGFIKINNTIVTTWGLMLVMTVGAKLITRKIAIEGPTSRWQGFLEIVVTAIQEQIKEVGLQNPKKYLPFIGTLFLLIALANLCAIIPGYLPPTGSLSTTTALALSVFVAVLYFGIEEQGLGGYLKSYLKPTFIMLPFNIISEFSRTFALAIRLFGNIMSGTMIVGILLTITPLIFPIFMDLLGLLTGMVQAYIFSILTTVYIAAATRTREEAVDEIWNHKSPINNERTPMDSMTLIAIVSIITAGITIAVGSIAPALGEGRAVSTALSSLAQQPDAATTITRTLFVGLAMIESIAIYCLVIAMILIFANPFWNHVVAQAAGK